MSATTIRPGASLEERLGRVDRALRLLQMAAAGYPHIDHDEDHAIAMRDLATEALDELYLIQQAPALVLNLPVPSDDDLRRWPGSKGPADEARRAGIEAELREQLARPAAK